VGSWLGFNNFDLGENWGQMLIYKLVELMIDERYLTSNHTF
jgi:hypothetical protein